MWFREFTLEELNNREPRDISALLGIHFTEIGAESLTASMPVNQNTRQPAGILHGGASVVLAETLGSVASNMVIDREKWIAVGLEVNANHLRPVFQGKVRGVCTPVHLGRTTHVWDIKLFNEENKISCISRLTTAIVARKQIK